MRAKKYPIELRVDLISSPLLLQSGGAADGLESDTSGKVYLSSPEHNAINTLDINTGFVSPFVRNPIIGWPDTLRSVTSMKFTLSLR